MKLNGTFKRAASLGLVLTGVGLLGFSSVYGMRPARRGATRDVKFIVIRDPSNPGSTATFELNERGDVVRSDCAKIRQKEPVVAPIPAPPSSRLITRDWKNFRVIVMNEDMTRPEVIAQSDGRAFRLDERGNATEVNARAKIRRTNPTVEPLVPATPVIPAGRLEMQVPTTLTETVSDQLRDEEEEILVVPPRLRAFFQANGRNARPEFLDEFFRRLDEPQPGDEE